MYRKRIALCVGVVIAIIAFIAVVCNISVAFNAKGRIYDEVSDMPHNRVALLLATSPITPRGGHNFYFDNRITAAYDLYINGKVDYIGFTELMLIN